MVVLAVELHELALEVLADGTHVRRAHHRHSHRREPRPVEYALRGHDQPLAVSAYAGLPDRVREPLPSAEDLSRIADGVLNTPQTTD